MAFLGFRMWQFWTAFFFFLPSWAPDGIWAALVAPPILMPLCPAHGTT